MRERLCFAVLVGALLNSASAGAQSRNCPFHEEGVFPWSANMPATMSGDLWAWVYLDLDKGGHPLRCYIGESNISGDQTKSNLCTGLVSGWKATPLMKDGVRVAGTTRRKVVMIGDAHRKMLADARKAWFVQHPDDNPACYTGTANN